VGQTTAPETESVTETLLPEITPETDDEQIASQFEISLRTTVPDSSASTSPVDPLVFVLDAKGESDVYVR
jgi:hypothetical protein